MKKESISTSFGIYLTININTTDRPTFTRGKAIGNETFVDKTIGPQRVHEWALKIRAINFKPDGGVNHRNGFGKSTFRAIALHRSKIEDCGSRMII